jgi:homoserine/homoserine lactone efflux protein
MIFDVWLTFAVAYLVTTLSPGPNVLLVIRNSLKYGASSALATIFGNLASQLMIVILVACGVGAMIAELPQFFLAMKIIGAGYLIFLGIKQINGARTSVHASRDNNTRPVSAKMSRAGVFREAFLVSSSNPKTLLFLSAFMPQFVDQNRAFAGQFAMMYLTIAVIVVCIHLIYSVSTNTLKGQVRNSRFMKAINYLGGSIFMLLGLRLLMSKRAVSV